MIDKDEWSRLTCGMCKYCNVKADMQDVVSTCKRLDHKHLKFWKPFFRCYDCGHLEGQPCRDFEPKPLYKWLYEHWEGFDDFYRDEDLSTKHVALAIDGDFSVMYKVRATDFIDNTFVNADGSLKWYERVYYIRAASGYRLVRRPNPEFLPGIKEEGG